jgi:hypothetical protein
MGIVEEFEELKPILQEKWLDFYSKNKNVLYKYLCDHHTSGYGNNSYVKQESVLAILISLEPKFSITITNYMKVCDYLQIQHPTVDNLLRILGIYMDFSTLDKQLKEREEKMKNQLIELPSPLDEFRNKNF